MLIQTLKLHNYRNFDAFDINFDPGITLIVGDNGAGKTNLLEAISLLTPGKGLRSATPEEICQYSKEHWAVNAVAETKMGMAHLSIEYSKEHPRKAIKFNDGKITNSELSNFTKIMWLTPQMDGIFLGKPGDRRKFLDRMVYIHFPNHASVVSKYEHCQKERMKLLETSPNDNTWLSIIERDMAILAVSLTENRLQAIEKLNKNIREVESVFPKAHLELESDIIDFLNRENPAEAISEQFSMNRRHDEVSGKTNFGPHRGNLKTFYASSQTPAEHCSTGQQKALLINIIIAQQLATPVPPILLLDEIFVHLDETRKEALGEFLVHNKAQCLITSTDKDLGKYLRNPRVVEME